MEEYGENRLYSHLNDQYALLFVLDEANYAAFRALGYFEDAVAMADMPGLYCATNDAPVARLYSTDEQYADYSQEFLDDVYLEYVAEHEELLSQAREVLGKVG